jgi:uncharacterized FlaG/YvyC family protein
MVEHLRAELEDEYKEPLKELLKRLNEKSKSRIYKNNLVKILLDDAFGRYKIKVGKNE